jgi:NAD(P)-dependent dehydrogenase (short-subunit alcohol dehydrogenase family)
MDVTAGTGRLQGKQVLVTGGTTGLGFAIAERFLREGARVVVTGRDEELGSRAQAKLGDAGQVWFVAADAGDPAALARSVDVAVGHLGALDVLVNNAGIGIVAGLLRTPLADYNRLMDVNVRGYFLYAQAAYPHLARRRGCMIHIASDAGVWGEQSIALYSVSKAAVVMLTASGPTCSARATPGLGCGTWPRLGKRRVPRTTTGRFRRSGGSARPTTWLPRRPSTPATRLRSSPGRRCWSMAA